MENYLRNWLGNLENYLSGYIYNEDGKLFATRDVFFNLQTYIKDFLDNKLNEKIILLPGIRGVGKTTLLAQVYFIEKYLQIKSITNLKNKIYITADHLIFNNFSLRDFFEFYENQLGTSVERLKEKTILLIDEIHYDKKWDLFLKLLFDRTKGHKNLLVIATGSSALSLQANPDLSRRSIEEKVFPMDFSEYTKLKFNIFAEDTIKTDISDAIFGYNEPKVIFNALKKHEKEIFNFWTSIPESRIEIEKYFNYGSFPFNLKSENKTLAFDKIISIIDRIIDKDIMELGSFDSTTISKIQNILYLLGVSDQTNLSKMSSALSLNIATLRRIFDTMVKAEIIVKVPSFGKGYTQARKEIKYLFVSPSIRNSILKGVIPEIITGKKLEDYSALLFLKERQKRNFLLFYDSSEGGADFILQLKNKKNIIIEVGLNKERVEQIQFTSHKIGKSFGILIGSDKLEIIDGWILKIPLSYWLLI